MIWLIIAGSVVVFYFLLMLLMFCLAFINLDKSPALPVKDPVYKALCQSAYDEFDSMVKEDVYIESFDHHKLHGYFIENEKKNKVVISFHGYNTEARKEYPLHFSYYRDGYTVLIVDQRGLGKSEGKFITMGISERRDCLKWIEYVVERYNGDVEILLDGLSMGASTIMMASKDIKSPQVRGMIANCGFDSCRDEIAHTVTKLMHLPKYPIMWTFPFYAKLFAKYDIDEITAHDSLSESDIPILMIHGKEDNFVPYSNMPLIFPYIKTRHKKAVTIENAAHGISCVVDGETFQNEIRAFMRSVGF